ncbi:hypothetical protein G9A89_013067 [Geosiphon pyriformis]|nr:hypothetical protein G9A89_013067 [Geosiphon pyriformis]
MSSSTGSPRWPRPYHNTRRSLTTQRDEAIKLRYGNKISLFKTKSTLARRDEVSRLLEHLLICCYSNSESEKLSEKLYLNHNTRRSLTTQRDEAIKLRYGNKISLFKNARGKTKSTLTRRDEVSRLLEHLSICCYSNSESEKLSEKLYLNHNTRRSLTTQRDEAIKLRYGNKISLFKNARGKTKSTLTRRDEVSRLLEHLLICCYSNSESEKLSEKLYLNHNTRRSLTTQRDEAIKLRYGNKISLFKNARGKTKSTLTRRDEVSRLLEHLLICCYSNSESEKLSEKLYLNHNTRRSLTTQRDEAIKLRYGNKISLFKTKSTLARRDELRYGNKISLFKDARGKTKSTLTRQDEVSRLLEHLLICCYSNSESEKLSEKLYLNHNTRRSLTTQRDEAIKLRYGNKISLFKDARGKTKSTLTRQDEVSRLLEHLLICCYSNSESEKLSEKLYLNHNTRRSLTTQQDEAIKLRYGNKSTLTRQVEVNRLLEGCQYVT